ncbi:hypothetical protein HPULCUR_002451 [Helicostylum pulchrum]|uniref:Arrestin-like N-terminal domain-containing protein n=1 Tax=Helicostylum pulchrum TaxID=562976 RepID=A0ABP9XQM5_9FUNG
MHISNFKSNHNKKEVIRVVLDEPRLYVEESLGSVMVRGEVIVDFSKDTHIQGPIELLFEGIQRFQTWPEIMRNSSLGSPIETKLQVIELSLLPPNSKGIMPAGVQRFPFEFPIPSTLPTTVYIPDRIEIFYQLSATIRRSSASDQIDGTNPVNWIDWARRNGSKKKYVACSPMRIVRAMESIVSNGLPINNSNRPHLSSSPLTPIISTLTPSVSTSITENSTTQSPWDRRDLSQYQGTLDEQHDQLAFSLSGRTSGNLNQPINTLKNVEGIRYKLGIDRTAIALGTSIGIELMIEPTFTDAVVKCVVLQVSENRKYMMKVPADHSWTTLSPEIKFQKEGVKMILKWAYGYEVENDEGSMTTSKKKTIHDDSKLGDKYVHQRSSSSQFLAYFDPPQPGSPNNKFFLGNSYGTNVKKETFFDSEEQVQEDNYDSSSSSFATQVNKKREMVNLKELNQKIEMGDYFGGRFVMPVPDCSNILHPSMEYESISVSHWIQLVVTIECNGRKFDLLLDSPGRVLDCRVVSVDDECQTILPPPPSYKPGEGQSHHENAKPAGSFWEQREAITNVSGWGSCRPCPCEYKKIKRKDSNEEIASGNNSNKNIKKANNVSKPETCSPDLLPEWGPPPCYSEY